MNDTAQVRVFVGIKIGDAVAPELVRLARPLEGASVRLMPAADLHVTLVPPWNETRVPAATDKLRKILKGIESSPLIFASLGYGPSAARPRLLQVECAENPQLARLRTLLLETFSQKHERPFRPHPTTSAAPAAKNQRALMTADRVTIDGAHGEGGGPAPRKLQSNPDRQPACGLRHGHNRQTP